MSAVLKDPCAGFRQMEASDIPAVLKIESQVYEFPWTGGIFVDCLRMAHGCRVYEHAHQVVAYGIVSVAAGESHLLNLSVAPESQGLGLGRRMLHHLVDISRSRKADTILLEVRPTNLPAIALYHSEGFNEVGLRRNYYPARQGREHALILARSLR